MNPRDGWHEILPEIEVLIRDGAPIAVRTRTQSLPDHALIREQLRKTLGVVVTLAPWVPQPSNLAVRWEAKITSRLTAKRTGL
jgi:hypothetical protein